LVTSTGKVLVPGIDNLLSMVVDQLLCLTDNVLRQARLSGTFDFRVQPKLRLTIRIQGNPSMGIAQSCSMLHLCARTMSLIVVR
jgi:hypothetical protein